MTDITDKLSEFLGAGDVMFICKKGNSWTDHINDFTNIDRVVVAHQNTVSNDEGERCTVCSALIKGPEKQS